jgi:hypothetical protein
MIDTSSFLDAGKQLISSSELVWIMSISWVKFLVRELVHTRENNSTSYHVWGCIENTRKIIVVFDELPAVESF